MNSKRKGNRNERKCAKVISEWVGIKFTKVPASGGMRLKDKSLMAGDLMPEESFSMDPKANDYMPFIFETKHLQKVPYKTPLPELSLLRNIWNKACEDANRSGKIPLCLIRENGMEESDYILLIGSRYFQMHKVRCEHLFLSDIFVPGYFTGYSSKKFFEKISFKTLCDAIK